MDTLTQLKEKFNLELIGEFPTEIRNANRESLAQWLHELDFKTGVEIGVASGSYSNKLCKYNPQMKIWGVDPWTPYPEYKDYVEEVMFESLEEGAHIRLDKYSNYTFLKEYSSDALKRFEDNSLDFVYLDGNHADPFVSEDINGWYKKIRSGGILAGHDYARPRIRGNEYDVIAAVNRFTKENNINPWFVIGYHAKEKELGILRDAFRSWMIIK